MFENCKSLISLNLSNLDISGVSNFGHMFWLCESLQMLEFSIIKTEKTKNLDYMFNGCKRLTSVNLSNLGTTNLETINNMFEGCEALKIIDFPNLDITKVNLGNLGNVFLNCPNLEYIVCFIKGDVLHGKKIAYRHCCNGIHAAFVWTTIKRIYFLVLQKF